MKLKIKKMVFAGLILVTVGATVGGVFIPPLFALAGTALIGTIGVGRIIVSARQENDNQNPSTHKPASPQRKNLSPPALQETKEDIPAPPELQRDFSMHITYKTNQHSPGGSVSPDAIKVSVHTRSPNSAHNTPTNSPNPLVRDLRSPSGLEEVEELASPRSPRTPRTPKTPRTPLPAYAASRLSHSSKSPNPSSASPTRGRGRTLPSPLKLTRKLTLPEDY